MVSFALLLTFPATHAASKQAEPIPSIELLEPLDSYRDSASGYVTDFANWIDNFFADDFDYDERQGSHIKLYLLQTHFEDDKPVYDAKIKAKLDLPKTQKKLQLLIESVDEDESNIEQTSISEATEDQEQSIALRYIQKDTDKWLITNIAGVRSHSGIDPFARFRIRRFIDNGPWTYRITESIFWFYSEGLGETTRLDIDHPLTKKLLFRSTTQATWKNINNYFDLGQDLILFLNINKRKSLSYQVGARGIRNSRVYTTDYFYSIRYRQQIHRNWLFFEVIPSVHHPEENEYKPIRSVALKLEIVFDAN